jgi:pimeloyl-ACP methyl ester carboxylesterase
VPSVKGFPSAERVDVGDVTLSVHAAGPKGAPLVVLLHGWPELAYSWKSQLGPIADLGFRVLAPDGRGFGASDAPAQLSAYGIDHLVSDVEGLLDHEGAERAVVVGHDWGGTLAWHFAMLRPERTAGVAALCTPHLPRSPRPTIEALRSRFGADHYIVQFQPPGVVERLFTDSLEDFFAVIFAGPPDPSELTPAATGLGHFLDRLARYDPATDPSAIPDADRAVFIEAYRRTGFTSGLNWYRNLDANWARMAGVDHVVRAPALMISAERDPILPPDLTRFMAELTPDLEKHVIPGVGHWLQWEAPEAVNRILCGWLGRRFGSG